MSITTILLIAYALSVIFTLLFTIGLIKVISGRFPLAYKKRMADKTFTSYAACFVPIYNLFVFAVYGLVYKQLIAGFTIMEDAYICEEAERTRVSIDAIDVWARPVFG